MKFLTITLTVLLSIISLKCQAEECIETENWKAYKQKFEVEFDNEVAEKEACINYEESLVKLVNIQRQRADLTYTVGETGVMHMNFTNYRGVVADEVSSFAKRLVVNRYQPGFTIDQIPKSFNWVEQGFKSPVKHQGLCGSCYSFSSIGGIEGQNFICNGDTKSLSEQYLLDCSPFARGCTGAFPAKIADLASTASIPYQSDYPYALSRCTPNDWTQHINGNIKSQCITRKQCNIVNNNGFKIDTVEHIEQGNENHLLTALYETGPILVTISIANDINLYTGGIYDSTQCSTYSTDHAVLLVGYTPDYYIIKNSWGANWGEGGYMRMARRSNNKYGTCAILAHSQVVRKRGCRKFDNDSQPQTTTNGPSSNKNCFSCYSNDASCASASCPAENACVAYQEGSRWRFACSKDVSGWANYRFTGKSPTYFGSSPIYFCNSNMCDPFKG